MSLTAEIDCVEIFARLSIIITINLQKCQLPAVALISSAREPKRRRSLLVLLHDGRNNCVLKVSKANNWVNRESLIIAGAHSTISTARDLYPL
jgi:hypothetical protein